MEQNAVKVLCECGSEVIKKNLDSHKKTKKHLKLTGQQDVGVQARLWKNKEQRIPYPWSSDEKFGQPLPSDEMNKPASKGDLNLLFQKIVMLLEEDSDSEPEEVTK
jgi:hypothetical protein